MKAIERIYFSDDLVTLAFLFCFVLLFFMKLYKPKIFKGYLIAFFTHGFVYKRANDNPIFFSVFHLFLFLFSTFIISLFIFLIDLFDIEKNLNSFLTICFCVISFLLFQYTIGYLTIKLVGNKKKINYLFFSKYAYLYTLNLLFFPFLVFYNYGYKNKIMLIIVFLILFLFRIFLIIKNNQSLIFSKLFYIILYFCTFELSFLLILYKIIKL